MNRNKKNSSKTYSGAKTVNDRPELTKGRNERRGFIQLYILHSLKNEPKSGYELIKEISEKTNGAWVPSKGALYPTLNKMEEENLIVIAETGKRSKNIFALTEKGTETLEEIIKRRKEGKEQMYVFRNLFLEIFSDESDSVKTDLMEIHFLLNGIADNKQEEAQAMIKQCLDNLKELEQR